MRTIILSLLMTLSSAMSFAYADDIAEIAHLRETADSLHSIGRTDSAAIVGEQAILLADKCGDPTQIVGTNAAQGVFLRSLGRIDEALQRYEDALAIITSGKFRENPDQEAIEEIASLYINLSVLNLDMQNKDEAGRNAVLAGDWIAKSDDTELKGVIYGVVGSVLTGCGDIDRALKYQDLAYRNSLESGSSDAAFRAAAYTMLLSDRSGDKAAAESWRQKCLSLMPQISSMTSKMAYYQAECSICLKNNDNRGAIIWFDKILGLEGIDNLPFVKFDCYNNMHLAYSELGDYQNAYKTLLQSNVMRDSLWAQEKAESLRDLTIKYETKETQLALAQSEAKRAGTLMWLFAALAVLLIGAVIFIVYATRQKRRRMQREMEFAKIRADIGRQLTQQYIEGLESERRRMAGELHDGVCNDLLAIQMNIKAGKSADSTASMIDACRESVRRISHELMPPEFSYASLDEVVRFFVAKQADANNGKIDFSYDSSAVDADWSEVPDATALEVYRIVQEATGNAVKHSGADEIKVILTLTKEKLEAAVSDNGIYRQKTPAGKKGVGLDSIRRRANAIGGAVSVEAGESGGTHVKLTVIL
ncbi:tetratricopeptide repeat-containing sensor histidine kinase [Muribaculum intestinale]|uniref:tetratricopeptide repeat-containing sensor histidine kinase n=1 Tax=Muribaculum intestinale TaxID=1796646 RepID=UPI002623C647|nr:ATP-binding protein [Muribaculum intestinale]